MARLVIIGVNTSSNAIYRYQLTEHYTSITWCPRVLQHCPDLRHVVVQTRAEITEHARKAPSVAALRGEAVGAARSGGTSLPLNARCHGWRGTPPFRVAVTTLCPFLLPPIRRHRSVIRNCVSLSSPYPIWLYGPTNDRTHSYVFLFPPSRSLSVSPSLLRLPPSLSACFLPTTPWFRDAVSSLQFLFFVFFPRWDNSRVNQR